VKVIKALLGIVVFAFVVLFVIGIVISNNSPSSSHATDSVTTSPPATSDGPSALPVSALQLFSDYQANEVAADQKYKGKALLVSGYISSINKDFTDSVYLVLATPNEFMGVHADLRGDEESKAVGLAKGQPVNVQCTGGGMVIGSPILKDCEIFSRAAQAQDAATPAAGVTVDAASQEPTAGVAAADSGPHDGGNAISVAPDATPSAEDPTVALAEALKANPDVRANPLGSGQVMLMSRFGPCGTLNKTAQGFIWATDAGNHNFGDLNSAVSSVFASCEATYREEKSRREAAESTVQSPQPASPHSDQR
jgi:hypothetical protein